MNHNKNSGMKALKELFFLISPGLNYMKMPAERERERERER